MKQLPFLLIALLALAMPPHTLWWNVIGILIVMMNLALMLRDWRYDRRRDSAAQAAGDQE